MFDYLRVSCAVPSISVGGVRENAELVCSMLADCARDGAALAVFPELTLTGYTCADLFLQQSLLDECLQGLRRVTEATRTTGCAAAVGLPLRIEDRLYNCAVLAAQGRVLGIVPKLFLPNYNEYYERRWFSSGEDLRCQSVTPRQLGLAESDEEIPVGQGLVFDLGTVRVGLELCEDLWTPLPPSTFLTLGGAELICNLSASNETIAKRQYRRELVCQQAARTLCAYAYCSAGAMESTQDLIFSGHSLICENGALLAENEKLIDTGYTVTADVDLGRLRADRMKNRSFADTDRVYGRPCRTVSARVPLAESDGTRRPLSKLPFVPSVQADRRARCRDIFQMQVAGLQKRILVTGGKTVIGVSGGLDSTLALLVSTRAMQELGRPLEDVVGITMPCFGTSDRTYRNSLELMRTLGIRCEEIPIRAACMQHFADIGQDSTVLDTTYENCQARERTQVLMDYAGRVGGFVVGTGDLSELALGWCTYNADHMSMYGVNASIPKTLIRWMIDSLVEFDVFPASSDVLRDVLDTPISPELLPPDAEGKIAQVTEDLVGPYELHDFFLYYVLRFGFAPAKIYALAKRAFAGDFDDATILKWLRSFYRRFFTQQFKRSCLPDGVKVGSVCLSPRGDWRMPSDATAAIWLAQVDELQP